MPKLTQASLEKRFTCVVCGKSVRSRQGLSGHIQFKHNATMSPPKTAPSRPSSVDGAFILKNVGDWELLERSASVPEAEIQLFKNVLGRWLMLKLSLESFGLETDQHDFKAFVVSSFAASHETGRLLSRSDQTDMAMITSLSHVKNTIFEI